MRRIAPVALVICSSSLFAQQESAPSIACKTEIAAAGAARGAVVANDCAAAKAFVQFSDRAETSRRTRIYDLNESALAAIENGRRDALQKAVQKLEHADRLAGREERSCQAVILNNLGMAHYFLAEFDDAIKAFNRAARYAATAPPAPPLVRPEEYAAFTPTPGTFTCFGQRLNVSEIVTNRGLANLRAKHLLEAEHDYDTVATDGASERALDLLDMLATAALDRKDDNEAVRISGKMRNASQAPIRVRRARTIEGVAHLRAGRLADALTAYEAAAAAGPPSGETQGRVHLALGEICMQLDPPRAGTAVEHYDQAAALITEQSGKERVVFGRAVALIGRGVETNIAADIQRGIEELSQFTTDDAKACIAFGHYRLGEFAAAAAAYETLAASSESFITDAAINYSRAGDWSNAVGVTDKALASKRGTEEQRLQWMELRGYAHYRLNDREEARADLEKVAAARYPNAGTVRAAYAILAASYANDRQWHEASRSWEAALATPFRASERTIEIVVLKNAAVAYEEQSPPDYPRAIAAYERLLVMQPDDRDVRLARADVSSRSGDAAKASTLYDELIGSGSVPPYVLVRMANRAFCAKRLDDAERLYRQAAGNPIAAMGLAGVLYVRGRQVKPLLFNKDLAAADAQYASIQPANDAERKQIAAMRGHIAYIRHDWKKALRFYANADNNDATIRRLVIAATKARAGADTTILPIGPEDSAPGC